MSVAERITALLDADRAEDALRQVDSAAPGQWPDAVTGPVLAARALVALGRREDAALRLVPPADAEPMARASLAVAAATLLGDDPARRAGLVQRLESGLAVFQDVGAADAFLNGLALAIRLHRQLRDDGLALDRARRLAISAQRLGRNDFDVVARLQAGLALEALGELASADVALADGIRLAQGLDTPELPAALASAAARVAARRGRPVPAGAPAPPAFAELEAALERDPTVAAAFAHAAYGLPRPALAAARERLTGAGCADLAALLTGADAREDLANGRAADALATLSAQPAHLPEWVADALAPLRAEALFRLGRAAEAVLVAEAAAPHLARRGFDGEAILAWLLAARAYRVAGRFEDARAPLDHARTLAATATTLADLVGLEGAALDLATGDAQAALDALDRYAGSPALGPLVQTLRGEALVALDRPTEALAALQPLPHPADAGLAMRRALGTFQARRSLGASTPELAAILDAALVHARAAGLAGESARIAAVRATLGAP